MIFKIFSNEIRRNKVINLTLFFFIMLSALLVSIALYVMIVLFNGVDQLLNMSDTPHFVQMHAGEVKQDVIEDFNKSIDYIKDFQLVEMICIDGADIHFNGAKESEAKSVMDISIVKQNKGFDFLLNLKNNIAKMKDNEIGVPIFYKNKKNLKIGDKIIFKHQGFSKVFVIRNFIRDSQMNPSLVSSKRFLISDSDFQELKTVYDNREYLIEYKFDILGRINKFYSTYTDSKMPKTGPTVNINLFRTLNALTDGIIVFILILISFLLTMIGILCLRYTLLSSIEEDVKEIGVMKAIGIKTRTIRYIYMAKYIVLASIACFLGYILSLMTNRLFINNITEYMGVAVIKIDAYIIPVIGVFVILLMIILSTFIILRKCKKITVVEALTNHYLGKKPIFSLGLKLQKKRSMPVDVFMGMNAVLSNIRSYMLLMIIFVLSTFIIIVPTNMLNTMQSSEFVNYMGVSRSDLRVDIRRTENTNTKIEKMVKYMKNDREVKAFEIFKTYRMKVINEEGELEYLPVEIGNMDNFPLDYLEGNQPKSYNEIALSLLAAKSLGKDVGNELEIEGEEGVLKLVVSGIYQDITNGGKSAKARLNDVQGQVLWYVININLKDEVDSRKKLNDYTEIFNGVKITDIDEYLNQTLGVTIRQLHLLTIFGYLIAVSIGVLISTLFLKMMLTKEAREIAILKSMGFSQRNLINQYMTRIMTTLIFGIIIGILLASTVGQGFINYISESFGASSITFIVNPLVSYVLAPGILVIAVSVTSFISLIRFRTTSVSRMIVE